MRAWKKDDKPFRDSLSLVAKIGMRGAGATGFAFFERGSEASAWLIVDAAGLALAADWLSGLDDPLAMKFLLRSAGVGEGMLVFVFPSASVAEAGRQKLETLDPVFQSLWSAQCSRLSYINVVEGIAELEARVLESKITHRARGLLASNAQGDIIETIAQHIHTVLHSASTGELLQRIRVEFQDELKERSVLAEAKAILQGTHGMSEEQAHIHLRRLSRRSRKRIQSVAQDVIENDGKK